MVESVSKDLFSYTMFSKENMDVSEMLEVLGNY